MTLLATRPTYEIIAGTNFVIDENTTVQEFPFNRVAAARVEDDMIYFIVIKYHPDGRVKRLFTDSTSNTVIGEKYMQRQVTTKIKEWRHI